MADLRQPQDVKARNERSLKTLERAIALSRGRFSLILVRCNYAHVRERVLEQLRERCIREGLPLLQIREIVLPESAQRLYLTIETELNSEQPDALMVLGLESVTAIDDLLASANQVRDEFRRRFSFPLVLWVNDEVLKKLVKLAPDFYSWASVPIQFAIETDELIEFLQQEADELFTKVLKVGADRFVANTALYLGMGAGKRFEMESALKELQSRHCHEPALEASQQFILGRDAYANNQMERAQQLYKQSLAFWQQKSDVERQACLLFHLGLLWRKYAVLYRAEYKTACSRARKYYHQCVYLLQQENRSDLAAKFINALGEALLQLERWPELKIVAKIAIKLHQTYPNSRRLAYAYGFLAEVALAQSAWSKAKQYAQTALITHTQLPDSGNDPHNQDIDFGWARQHYRSWYRLSLARSQKHLDQVSEAWQNLETAKIECKHEYNPQLYLRILEELRSLHFEQGQYLDAFHLKQEQLQIKQEYGLWAFIGAGRLEPQRQVIHPTLVGVESCELDANAFPAEFSQVTIAQEIVASGRKQDVDRLIERMTRNDQKLIVIHGLSGVGKSSLLTAGLVPALHQISTIDGRNFLPVIVRAYTNWVRELGQVLKKAIGDVKGVRLSVIPDSVEAILEQLRINVDRNLLTVLIFDQFEEFFFNCTKPTDRRIFWGFLHLCLDRFDIPYVKVIVSLREDYLHYLLECDRLTNLEITKNDILNREIRYSIGNFSPEDAKHLIQSLTQNSFDLEPVLIDELVRELAGDLGEVRPIELQVVGAQLQEEKIITLAQYRQSGPKDKLVERFLEEVVKDCGAENERAARLVLYLLTDENGTRPLKTRTELAADLAAEAENLDLVLEIFVRSGLVLLLPEIPTERYQLVHDYLVSFIRQQQGSDLLAELAELRQRNEQSKAEIETLRTEIREKELLEKLAKEQEQRKLTEEELKRAEHINRILTEAQKKAKRRIRRGSAILLMCLAIATTAGLLALKASQRLNEIQTGAKLEQETASAWRQFETGKELEALVLAIRTGKNLKTLVRNNRRLQNYPATSPLLVLQKMLENIHQQNQLNGHQRGVNSVDFSPDGKRIITASDDGTARLWDLSGKQLVEFKGHQKPIRSVSFSLDGQHIATASADGTARLWDLNGKQLVEFKEHQGEVNSVSISPDGKHLATAGDDGTTRLWNLSGKLLVEFERHPALVKSVSFSPDGQHIATAGDKGTVRLWNLKGQLLQEFIGHQHQCRVMDLSDCRIMSVRFSPDGQRLVTGGYDKTIRLWDLKGKQLKQWNSDQGAVLSISFSPDGQRLASTGDNGITHLWDLKQAQKLEEFRGNIEGNRPWVMSASFSPDGQHLVTGEKGGTVRLWNLNEKQQIKFRANPDFNIRTIVSSVSFSPDGQHLATAAIVGDESREEGPVRLWNSSGKLLAEFKGHPRGALSLSFSPNGQLLASAGADRIARLWNLSGKQLVEFKGHKEAVRSVSFSPNGQLLATASEDRTARLWNLKGQQLQEFLGHTATLRSVSFSPNGQRLATASEDGTVRIWNLKGQQLARFTGRKDGFMSLSFSPDGRYLVAGGYDGTVRLLNLKGEQLKEFDSYQIWVMSVSVSPDGQRLATAGKNNTVRLWNLNGQQLAEFTGHQNRVWSTSFSPDGQYLATSSHDGTVRLWPVEGLDELLSRGCNWVDDYLKNNPNAKSDRYLCDDILTQK